MTNEEMMKEIEHRNQIVAERLGKEGVCDCLIEECSELIQALLKYRRACGIGQPTSMSLEDAKANVVEEIADVSAALSMYRYLMDISDADLQKWFETKSARAIERMSQHNVRKVNCSITEDEYNKGLNDLREGARKVVKQLSKDDFIKNNCHNCGTQRCGGPDTEWFEGCSLKDELKQEE